MKTQRLCGALLLALLPTTASAADVGAGLDWLEEARAPDGGFGLFPARSTALVSDAHRAVGAPLTSVSPEALALEDLDAAGHDARAWRLLGLEAAGVVDLDGADALLQAQGADGGWGPLPGWASSVPETARALSALAATGASPGDALRAGATWLVQRQEADGGWAFEGNAASLVLTAEVVMALDALGTQPSAVADGRAWLLDAQGEDGAFGAGPDAALFTAQALWALSGIGDPEGAWRAGADALDALQLADGSWEGDVVATAAALRALGADRPNLIPTALTLAGLGGADPVEGEAATITVTVRNTGRRPMDAASSVALYLHQGTGQDPLPIGVAALPALGEGEAADVAIPWDTTGRAGHLYLLAEVDPGDVIAEGSEADNSRLSSVYLTPRVDVEVTAADLSLDPDFPGVGEDVTITAQIHNRGGTDASGLVVAFYEGDPGEGGALLGQETLGDLPPFTRATAQVTHGFAEGSHPVYVVVDPEDAIQESIESNNVALVTVEVTERFDFAGSYERIWASAASVVEPEIVTIQAVILNLREDDAEDVPVRCSVYNTSLHSDADERVSIDADVILPSLPGGGSAPVTCRFDTRGFSGKNYVYVEADPDDVFREVREDNNHAITTVEVTGQSNVYAEAIYISPSDPEEGETVRFYARIGNDGGVEHAQVPVRFRLGDPGEAGEDISPEVTATLLKVGEEENTANVYWDSTGAVEGEMTVYAIIDPEDRILEVDEADNVFALTFTLKSRANLLVEGIGLDPGAPESGDAVTATVRVVNGGGTDAAAAFAVQLFDGDPEAGGAQIGGDVILAGLDAQAGSDVAFEWDTQGLEGAHTLVAVVDAAGAVDERYTADNRFTQGVTLAPPTHPELRIEGGEILASARRGVPPGETITFTVPIHGDRDVDAEGVALSAEATGIPFASADPTFVPGLGTGTASIDWVTPGSLVDTTVDLVVDPLDAFEEVNEADNRASLPYKSRLPRGTEPTGLAASVDYHTVSLSWDASPAPDIAAYWIWRGDVRANASLPAPPDSVSAISESNTTSRGQGNAVDGDPSTYWQSQSHGAPFWYELQLPEARAVSALNVQWYINYRGVAYELQGWDGDAWETLLSVSGNSEETLTHPAARTLATDRYRVYITQGVTTAVAIREVSLLGFDPAIDLDFVDVDVPAGDYAYTVTAVAASTFESPDSNVAAVSIAPVAAPSGLVAGADYTRVDLRWDPVDDSGLVSYLVYRDGALVHDRPALSGGSLTDNGTYSSSYPVANATDSDEGSYWRSKSGGPWILTWDLEDITLVTGFNVLWNGSYRGVDYVLDAWDGDAWVRLQTVEDNGASRVAYAWEDPVPTERLRLSITASTSSTVGIYTLGVQTLAKVEGAAYADTHLNSGPYAYGVAGINRLGEIGIPAEASANVPAPEAPASLTVAPGVNAATLSWPAVPNPALASYLVRRDGIPVDGVTQRERIPGVTTQASSTYNSSYTASEAVDGTSGYWRSGSNAREPTWEIAFPAAQVITNIELDWNNSYEPIDFDVEVFDGKRWRMLDSVEGNTLGYTRHPLASPFAAQRFRVVIHSYESSTVGLIEAYFFGYGARKEATLVDGDVPSGPHTWDVQVLDIVGELSPLRAGGETLALPAPSGLVAVVDGDNVALSWTAAVGEGVVGYRLTRGGEALGGRDTARNLTQEGVLSASSQSSSSYAAAEAGDGSTSTRWIGANDEASYWIRLDLPRPVEIANVQCLWYSAQRGIDYKVQTLEEGVWITRRSVTGNGSNNVSHTLERPVTTSAVRVFITDQADRAPGLYELRVYPLKAHTELAFTDWGVDGGDHLYGVQSLDALGGVSAMATATAVIEEVLAPTLTQAELAGSAVSLAWTPGGSPGVLGYRVYRDGTLLGDAPDIAGAATATANSFASSSSSYQASNANDGSGSTRWRSSSAGGEKILTLTWPEPHKLSYLRFVFDDVYFPTDFTVETWDGAAWQVEEARTGNGFVSIGIGLNSALTTNRVRIRATALNSTYLEIYEVEAQAHVPVSGLTYTDALVHDGRYRYCVKAVTATFVSPCSEGRTVDLADTEAPGAPTGGYVSAHTVDHITLAWDGAPEADIYGWNVYFEGSDAPLNSLPVADPTYRHTGVINRDQLTYAYVLEAVDVNGNAGPPAAPVVFAPDPLGAPPGFIGAPAGQGAALQWEAHPDPLAASFAVFRDGEKVGDYITALAFTDPLVPRGEHVFTVATRDLFGRLGAPSEALSLSFSDLDYVASSTSLFVQPQSPSELDDLRIQASFRNGGDSQTPAVAVDFYDGDPDAGGIRLGRGTLPSLAPDALGVAEITWTLTGQGGTHTLFAVVDPDQEVLEYFELNNTARLSLEVSEVPELFVEVGEIDASAFPEIVATVGVVTPQGQPVAGLRPQNFALLEDSLAQGPLTVVETSQLGEVAPLTVDIVVLVDASGSMDAEWIKIPEIVDDLGDALYVRGIDARIVKLSLADSVAGYDPLTVALFDGEEYPLSCGVPCTEDWAPGTTWLAERFDWRPDAVRVVIPAADEDAYHGEPEDADDLQAIQEAGAACRAENVLAFPLWGEGAADTVIRQMRDLAALAAGEAFYYEDADLIVPYMVDAIEAQFAQYEITWVTLNDLPDGSERLVNVTARFRGAEGADAGTYLAPGLSRLDLVAESITLDPPAPLPGERATLTASILSRSTVSVEGGAARLWLEDGLGGALPLGDVASLGTLAPGARVEITAAWDASPGPWTLAVEVDPEDALAEEDEANNRASLDVDLPGAPAYALSIPEGGVAVSPVHPVVGDHGEVRVRVQNQGQLTKGALLALYLGDPAEGDLIGPMVALPPLPRGSEMEVAIPWDTADLAGEVALTAWVDPVDAFPEANEENNRRALAVPLTLSPYGVAVAADALSYGAGEDALFTATVVNRAAAPFSGAVRFTLVDGAGELAADLGEIPVVDLPAAVSEDAPTTLDVPLPWSVGATLAGPYAITATLVQGEDVRGTDTDPFDITATLSLLAEVGTDWTSYDPWERVFVEAGLTNTSTNGVAAPTEGVLTLYDPEGEAAFTESFTREALAPGAELTWTTDIPLVEAAPGTWTLALVGLIDGEAVALAEAPFEVRGTGGEARSLAGALAITPDSALVGEALALTWRLENRGNEALVALPVRVVIASERGEVAYGADLDTVTLPVAGEAEGTGALDSGALGVGAYLAHLMVDFGGEETSVAVARFSLVNILGTLSVTPEVAEGGVDTLTLGYGLTNRSDGALQDIPLAISLVSDEDGVERGRVDFTLSLAADASAEGEAQQPSAPLALGAHTARLVTLVEGGELTLAEAPFEIGDTLAPTTMLTWVGTLVESGGARYASGATRYILESQDGFSGVASIRVTVDASAEAPYEGPIALASEGAHTLSFFGVDGAGNREIPGRFEVTTDERPPVIAFDPLDGGGCLTPGDALAFTVTDLSPTEVNATLDGAPFESGSPVTGEGDHTVVVTATDVLGHVASRAAAFTLSEDPCACAEAEAAADGDGDGIPACGGDCDDGDPRTYPGAVELCDGVDNGCDGGIDEDVDGDGYGACEDCDETDALVNPGAVEGPGGVDDDCDGRIDEGLCLTDDDGDDVTALGGDCDDGDPAIRPGAIELPGGVDDDCDGSIDEGTAAVDDDGDGFSEVDGDCDDTRADVAPGLVEALDGVDNDCDGALEPGAVDGDGDGVSPGAGDCDDGDPDRSPRASERPNGADDDCDGAIDEGTQAFDDDGDGLSEAEGDCDDSAAFIYPEAPEAEDGRDGDCDGVVDEGHRPCDLDGDGVTELEGDCDDTRGDISPEAPEVCLSEGDATDEDCDGAVDEGDVCGGPAEEDADGDGYLPSEGDCDDGDAAVYPGQAEACDGVDEDCDGSVDEGLTLYTQWPDDDGDGVGAGDADAPGEELCEEDAPGYAGQTGDCDDSDPNVSPEAQEACDDGEDDDCDGAIDEACASATPTGDGSPEGCGCGTSPGAGGLPSALAGATLLLAGLWLRRRGAGRG